MSHDSHFSHEEDPMISPQGHIEEVKPPFKRPEFILIDDRVGEKRYTYFGSEASGGQQGSQKEQQAKKSPLSLRFISLLGFIFCFIFGLGMLLWSIVMTSLATLSLFQNKKLNQGMCSFWKLFANTFVAGFGFTLGLISPPLGLGLVALYFSLSGNWVEEDFLRKIIRRSFSQI